MASHVFDNSDKKAFLLKLSIWSVCVFVKPYDLKSDKITKYEVDTYKLNEAIVRAQGKHIVQSTTTTIKQQFGGNL